MFYFFSKFRALRQAVRIAGVPYCGQLGVMRHQRAPDNKFTAVSGLGLKVGQLRFGGGVFGAKACLDEAANYLVQLEHFFVHTGGIETPFSNERGRFSNEISDLLSLHLIHSPCLQASFTSKNKSIIHFIHR